MPGLSVEMGTQINTYKAQEARQQERERYLRPNMSEFSFSEQAREIANSALLAIRNRLSGVVEQTQNVPETDHQLAA
jgi:hypothetical protein